MKIRLSILLISIIAFSLTACTNQSAPTAIRADIILLDISGSSTNSVGSFNAEDHSPSSLSERKRQLEDKLKNSISQRTAIYFGFVKKNYGRSDIVTLVPAGLILEIDSVLKKDIQNEKLKTEASDGISSAWAKAIDQEKLNPDSCVKEELKQIIIAKSNAAITDENANRISSKLCTSAMNSMYQFNQLKTDPENIGSDIQGSIDRALQKIASDEKRLLNSDMKPVVFKPTIFLVSDLIQVSGGKSITTSVFAAKDNKGACELARVEAKSFTPPYDGNVELISDGFAGTKSDINSGNRDKLMEYWKCWFESRLITQIDIGAKGIDLGAL